MKTLKKTAKKILASRVSGPAAVNIVLRAHSLAYRLSGMLSQAVEPGGLHPKHRLMDYHDWYRSKLESHWTVLDVGCGNGSLAGDIVDSCGQIVAIDCDPEKIMEARKLNAGKKIEFIVGDATEYPFERKFDAVILSNVLEHIRQRVRFLKKMSLRCDTFLIRVPMLDRDWITLYKKERGVPFMLDPGHYTEYTLDSFSEEISAAGLIMSEHRIRYGELYSVCKRKDLRDI